MPTKNPRFSVALPVDLWDAVNKYQHKNRLGSQNMAINALIQRGLDAMEYELNHVSIIDNTSFSAETLEFAMLYDHLDAHSRKIVRTVAELEAERSMDLDREPAKFRTNIKSELSPREQFATEENMGDSDQISSMKSSQSSMESKHRS